MKTTLYSAILLTCLLFFYSCKEDKVEETPKKEIVEEVKPKPIIKYGFNFDNYKVINDTIKSGESFGIILDRHHVFYPKINEISTTIKDTFDVRKVRAGKPYTILASKDTLEKAQVFIYKHNRIESTIINFQDSLISAYKYRKPVTTIERAISGRIVDNFSNAIDTLGYGPTLAYEVADIYSWTVDFYRLQKDDTFKLIFEQKFIEDSIPVGYGRIKAAVFNHKGKDLYAYRYIADSIKGIPEYYDDEAGLLRRQFLKSPIKFQYRISSRYNLKRRIKLYGNRVRAHKGTDFAAPYGTPIMATASGTVTESSRRGGNGNYVKVRHNGTYSTQYLHMKRRKVRVGEFVQQGDVIGWVGMTGNTSGPHVCYRFWKNGRQVDPFREKLPTAKPMVDSLRPKYFEFIAPLKRQLDSIPFSEVKPLIEEFQEEEELKEEIEETIVKP
ncbi:murein DD-endopeptidase MepM/ murein hydrolase activator NlpD [Tenacibaculum skagerrakense]|uniref:Murein DD-endopeptidase MepM/ murein hydrolase activator NlpD n=1 Tax=Tenacibaculum skagerrakense TaxID=186571 RepID=A0A4R2P0C2_9FLAO|nr:peptidoglycan DD-metalloendopeptidase family protein [Tenacibaculum skagerrakense]TCP28079.1 murein DD-endopeptidase MepM/ murein hydrolase activator NlpD [Tenacibaculum skagerrakense]